MSFLAFVIASFFIIKSQSICSDSGDSDRDTRFNTTSAQFPYILCYKLRTVENCPDGKSSPDVGTYVSSINQTCVHLDVEPAEVSHTIYSTHDYRGSERCGCLTQFGGTIVMVIDANPILVNDAIWLYRILHTIDWFYHGIINRRDGLLSISLTLIFAHGNYSFETSDPELYGQIKNVSLNPWIWNATSLQSITYPCNAINRAIDILRADTRSGDDYRKWLFYWGFSTPDLTGCTPDGHTFAGIGTYAMRASQLVDLSSIESMYGEFDSCNWYSAVDANPTSSQAIQDRAIIGTFSDFLCVPGVGFGPTITAPPTPLPTQPPITPLPTQPPVVITTSTTSSYVPTYAPTWWISPTSEPTAQLWWSWSRHSYKWSSSSSSSSSSSL